jgi:hypothetical protein
MSKEYVRTGPATNQVVELVLDRGIYGLSDLPDESIIAVWMRAGLAKEFAREQGRSVPPTVTSLD